MTGGGMKQMGMEVGTRPFIIHLLHSFDLRECIIYSRIKLCGMGALEPANLGLIPDSTNCY